jgi:hypothetical protein
MDCSKGLGLRRRELLPLPDNWNLKKNLVDWKFAAETYILWASGRRSRP